MDDVQGEYLGFPGGSGHLSSLQSLRMAYSSPPPLGLVLQTSALTNPQLTPTGGGGGGGEDEGVGGGQMQICGAVRRAETVRRVTRMAEHEGDWTNKSDRSINLPDGGVVHFAALPRSDAECTLPIVIGLVDEVRRLDREIVELSARLPSGGDADVANRQPSLARAMLLKKIIGGIRKGLRGVRFYEGADRCMRQIRVGPEIVNAAEYESLIRGKGVQVQPAPDRKPRSSVIVREFSRQHAIVVLGDVDVKGEVWTRGGRPTRERGGRGRFDRGQKQGVATLELVKMQLIFSTKSSKLVLVFTFINNVRDEDEDDEDEDDEDEDGDEEEEDE